MFAVSGLAQEPSLTIYNKDFAVVRDTVPLTLQEGVNEGIRYSGMTATAESESVMLRDPAGKMKFKILAQSYRNDPISREMLLMLNEGNTIDFVVKKPGKEDRIVKGKIVSGGYSHDPDKKVQPVIEVNGKEQFTLPGEPLFPAMADDSILNPTISWKLKSDAAGKCDAQIAYVTDGLSWHAVYNVVGSESSDEVDLVGCITFENESGRTFRDARIKFMAGDVNTLPPWQAPDNPFLKKKPDDNPPPVGEMLPVDEKAFSEYHLYTISDPVTLHYKETKQVEFVRARGVKTHWVYVYDGATQEFGQERPDLPDVDDATEPPINGKVWMMREFKNSGENHLGVPLPFGLMFFYQQDTDKQLEFTSHSEIDHTAKDEMIRVYAGNSSDLAGWRRRTEYRADEDNQRLDEACEIKLRNHKKTPVEIRTVEHLIHHMDWTVTKKSDDFTKINSDTIEFRSTLKPNEERTITYHVHYTWREENDPASPGYAGTSE